MTNLVARLRARAAPKPNSIVEMAETLCDEAADRLELVDEEFELLQAKVERYEREIGRRELEYPDYTQAVERVEALEAGLRQLRVAMILNNCAAVSGRTELLHSLNKVIAPPVEESEDDV